MQTHRLGIDILGRALDVALPPRMSPVVDVTLLRYLPCLIEQLFFLTVLVQLDDVLICIRNVLLYLLVHVGVFKLEQQIEQQDMHLPVNTAKLYQLLCRSAVGALAFSCYATIREVALLDKPRLFLLHLLSAFLPSP